MVSLVMPTDAPAIKGPPQGRWTLSDWEKLPDDGNRYEIIDGVLYMSTAPGFTHQRIISRLYKLLGIPAEEQDLGVAIFAPFGVFMPGCNPVQPDFVFVSKSHADIIQERGIFGIPDLIVEILSPGNRAYDEEVKFQAYATAGVAEYGIIDSATQSLRLNRSPAQGEYKETQVFDATQTVTFACLPGIALVVGNLFEGAPDTTL